jgi:hypothetical protein
MLNSSSSNVAIPFAEDVDREEGDGSLNRLVVVDEAFLADIPFVDSCRRTAAVALDECSKEHCDTCSVLDFDT